MIYVFLAEGFEETEAVATIDVLRRAELPVKTVAVGTAGTLVAGAHGIPVQADIAEAEVTTDDMEAVVLPGGMPGTLNLERSETVKHSVTFCVENEKLTAAICAAPSILGHMGCLNGKKATCYPGFEQELQGAAVSAEPAVRDGNIITGKGPGAAIPFALMIVEAFCGGASAEELRKGLQY